MSHLKLFCVINALVVFVFGCGQSPVANNAATGNAKASPTPAPASTPAVADGKELYALNCMICHQETGRGGRVSVNGKNLNVEDLTEDKLKKASDEKLIGYVTNGIEDEGMPAFKDKLKPEEIKAIVAHVRALQGR